MMNNCVATQADVREGGIEHLIRCLDTLNADFDRLDGQIDLLAGTLNTGGVPVSAENDGPKAPARSVVENLTYKVRALQERSELQRRAIESIREAIQ